MIMLRECMIFFFSITTLYQIYEHPVHNIICSLETISKFNIHRYWILNIQTGCLPTYTVNHVEIIIVSLQKPTKGVRKQNIQNEGNTFLGHIYKSKELKFFFGISVVKLKSLKINCLAYSFQSLAPPCTHTIAHMSKQRVGTHTYIHTLVQPIIISITLVSERYYETRIRF